MCPDAYMYFAPMLLFQKIIIAIEMLTRNQIAGIYGIAYQILSPWEHHANSNGKKLATLYFYCEEKVLQQSSNLISLPEEHQQKY